MKVVVHILPTRKERRVLDLKKGALAEDAIRALGLYPDGWIPVRNEQPIPLDEPLTEGDEIKLISVVSGG